MSAPVRFFVVLFLGPLGIHKFIDGKVGMGILYLCTCGLCGFGWLYDLIVAGVAWGRASKASGQSFVVTVYGNDRTANHSGTTFTSTQRAPAENSYSNSLPATRPVKKHAHTAAFVKRAKKKFIAYDLETTGLSHRTDRIIEIGAVLFEDFKPTRSWGTLVNPECPIPPAATKVNGITDQMVASAPSEADAIQQFCDFVGADLLDGKTLLVGHNSNGFDRHFLLSAFRRLNIESDLSCDDTLLLSRKHFDLPQYKLNVVADHLGIDTGTDHRAVDDANTCGLIYANILEKEYNDLCCKPVKSK